MTYELYIAAFAGAGITLLALVSICVFVVFSSWLEPFLLVSEPTLGYKSVM